MNRSPSLPETLARINALCDKLGKSLDDVLNSRELSYATGLTEAEVQALLAGAELPGPDPDAMVRQRVRFLYETRTGDNNQPRDIAEIATATAQTTTWVKKLVTGESKPNIHVGAQLTRFYDVSPGFLTDLPADALNRELQPILIDLEVEADPRKTLADLGVRGVAGRSPRLDETPNLVELAKWVATISQEMQTVHQRLQRHLGNAEGDR